MESSLDKSEMENQRLKVMVQSYEDRLDEMNGKMRALQDNLNETATDEVAELMAQLTHALSDKVPFINIQISPIMH